MPLVVMDENMEIVGASREAFSMFGIRPDPNNYSEQLHELAITMSAKQNLIPSIGAMTFKLLHVGSNTKIQWQDGIQHFDIEIFTLPSDHGIQYGINFIDTTETMELGKDLDTTRTYLEGILDSIPLGIVVMNRLMQVTAMNLRQQDIMKITGQDISRIQAVGSDVADLFSSQQKPSWEDVKTDVMKEGKILDGIVRQKSTLDEERVFSIEVAPLKNSQDEIVGAVRICGDITIQTRMEEQARESGLVIARLETIKQVAVTLNHVINNALAVLLCNLDLIAKYRASLPEIVVELLGGMQKESERLKEFVIRFSEIKEIKTANYTEDEKEKMIDV